ncbi:secretin N-terminal domain-containing protein, partial [Candidatus Omnitrophota bacterium]
MKKFQILFFFIIILSGLSRFAFAETNSANVERALDVYEQMGRHASMEVIRAQNRREEKEATYRNPPRKSRDYWADDVATQTISVPVSDGMEELSEVDLIDVLELKDMDIVDVLKLLSQKSGLNIIAGKNVSGRVTIYLNNVKLKDALRIILDANDLAYKVEDGIIRVMPATEYESRYGQVFGGEILTQVIRLAYMGPADIEGVLTQIKSPKGKIISDATSNTIILMDTEEKLRVMERLAKEMDVPVRTKIFELSYASVKDIADKISEHLTQNVGEIRSDERSNKIIVTDTPAKLEQITNMVYAFDTKEEQVLIEAKIVQVVLSDQHKFGVDWEAIIKGYRNLNLTSNFDKLSSSDKGGTLSVATMSEDDFGFLIEALETNGQTNILSSPRITTLNNKEAKMLVGSTEP